MDSTTSLPTRTDYKRLFDHLSSHFCPEWNIWPDNFNGGATFTGAATPGLLLSHHARLDIWDGGGPDTPVYTWISSRRQCPPWSCLAHFKWFLLHYVRMSSAWSSSSVHSQVLVLCWWTKHLLTAHTCSLHLPWQLPLQSPQMRRWKRS